VRNGGRGLHIVYLWCDFIFRYNKWSSLWFLSSFRGLRQGESVIFFSFCSCYGGSKYDDISYSEHGSFISFSVGSRDNATLVVSSFVCRCHVDLLQS
jgi:hypothetical protein